MAPTFDKGVNMHWIVTAPEETATLYLAWEYGTKSVAAIKESAEFTRTIFINKRVYVQKHVTLKKTKTRREAQKWALRIEAAHAYQLGRLRRPLKAALVRIEHSPTGRRSADAGSATS